ncbi:uncharacterized protein LOC135809352 [Sycon ciliatum]|uniref:uncharacterized protein LOC135809352 n=1 Tax=Sycon ciliatum TaxID=27933 RepID=UPI0031F6562D
MNPGWLHGMSSQLLLVAGVPATQLDITLRSQAASSTGRLAWSSREEVVQWKPAETCIILVDVWDKHWCPTATERLSALAMLMNQTLSAARELGVLIIHAPSDCMAFYVDYPQRKWVLELPNVTVPKDQPHAEPAFPLDASDGGCDVPATSYQAWHRENRLITIAQQDAISAGQDGRQTSQEIYNVLSARGIRNVLYAGVHENMCIMTRPFAIKQLVAWDKFNVALIRELVDVMYNPMLSPYVSHAEGTTLMTEFIEKFWAPSMSMYDFLNPRKSGTAQEAQLSASAASDMKKQAEVAATLQRQTSPGKRTCEAGEQQGGESLQCGSPDVHYTCPWQR